MMRRFFLAAFAVSGVALVTAQIHQGPFTDDFPPEEFRARRAQLMDRIGDAVAILQGTIERPGEQAIRQNNHVFYLTGVEVTRAIVVIDGRSRRSAAYIPPLAAGRVRAQGPEIGPGAEAEKITGLDAVLPRDDFAGLVKELAAANRVIYTPHRPEVLGNASAGEPRAQANATRTDPWDGRPSRETVFIEKLKAASPSSEIRDLDPLVDSLRAVKSAREIAVIRAATRIAGLGIMEAMREAEVGMFEYELQAPAEYVFKRLGSQGAAYFALVATGPNTMYSHYHRGTRRLADGDLVQFDYAPDYKYYVSDVTRVFPANGTFTPLQREFYTIYLRMYQALMDAIKPGVPVGELTQAAGKRMQAIVAGFTFTNQNIKAAAQAFADGYAAKPRGSFGHAIGMEVHDVADRLTQTVGLRPGQLFTIEPPLRVPQENLWMRLEDALLVTETGYENLSAFVPLEIGDIEKLMAQPGLSRAAIKK